MQGSPIPSASSRLCPGLSRCPARPFLFRSRRRAGQLLSIVSVGGHSPTPPLRLAFTRDLSAGSGSRTALHLLGSDSARGGRWCTGSSTACRAAGKGFASNRKGDDNTSSSAAAADKSRQIQVDSTKLLSTFLQAEDLRAAVQAHAADLQEDFFVIASTYLEMAKKEGEDDVVSQLESVLRVAMEEKEKTLRPEIRLLNQLLRDKTPSERLKTMASYSDIIVPEGYFFSLLNRMLLDVEASRRPQEKLLSQLRMIKREADEQAKSRVKS